MSEAVAESTPDGLPPSLTPVPQFRVGRILGGRILIWGSLIKFSHTIFALPFALAMLLVTSHVHRVTAAQIFWIVFCLISARTAAMVFNRLIDADFDLRNPRTAGREIPRGSVSVNEAVLLTCGSSAAFLFGSAMLGRHCLVLAPGVLVVLLGYSLAKRFTAAAHIILGLALACAPGGVWYALTAEFSWIPIPMMTGVLLWVAGFDIVYACQDADFDRAAGLRSIPAALGISRSLQLARILHVVAIGMLVVFGMTAGLGVPYYVGVSCFSLAMLSQHLLVNSEDLSKVDLAFFTRNGLAGFLYLTGVIFDTFY